MRSFVDWVKAEGFLCHSEVVDSGKFQLFPLEERILEHCLTPKEDGSLPYRRIIVAQPKKSGKTVKAAAIGTWYLREIGTEGCEVYACANDMEQAEGRVFAAMRWHFDKENKDLPPVDRTRTQKYRVDLANGSSAVALAKHYRSAAGSQVACSLWDELWAYCLTPVKILTADLRWVMSDELQVGDKIVAFDEYHVGKYRSYRTGTVTAHDVISAPTLTVYLSNGEKITGTPVHKILARHPKWNRIDWMELKDLKPGDWLFRAFVPWDDEHSEAQGYLAAAFDGEGCLSMRPGAGYRLDLSQRNNQMLREVKSYLSDFGFEYWCNRETGGTYKDVHGIGLSQRHAIARFLGSIRPRRLLPKFVPELLGRMTAQEYVEVVRVDDSGEQDVVAMSVDCGTYVSEGYCSHNTSEDSMRMWAEMTIPPTVKNPLQVIVTYAGYENESPNLLLDLYKRVVKNGTVVEALADITDHKGPVCFESGGTFCYWDHEPRMPWQTPEYYEQEMQSLRPSDFLRMHRVEWVTTEEEFMPIEWYDKCTVLTAPLMLQPDNPARTLPLVIGVDIGVKHDCTAAVGMYYDMMKPQVGLAFHRIWTPPPGMIGLDLEETIEKYLMEMCNKFRIAAIVYDPSQFHRSMVTLHKKGLNLAEFTQSSANMIAATQNMYDLFRQHIMAVYPDEELRQHIHFAKAKVDERGFRLVKDKDASMPIDGAVAMAMAAYQVVKIGGIDTSKKIKIESPFSDATAWSPTYIDQSMLPEPLRDKERR